MDYVLCINALDSALSRRETKKDCIHHSDQGSQYRSEEYLKYLKDCGFRISMSDKGSPTQNAYIESFFKTLKYEEIYFRQYKTIQDVMKKLPKFIEEIYNAKRLHSSLSYKSHLVYEKELTDRAS
jgi:putative transposase